MEVILLQDVRGLGKKGDIKKVSDGYASNFLLPRKFAVMKTEQNLEAKKREDAKHAAYLEEQKQNAIALKHVLEDKVVEFEANVGQGGLMFGSISLKQVEEGMKKQFDIDIDRRKILNTEPLNSLGYHIIKIELWKGVVATFKVHISGRNNK